MLDMYMINQGLAFCDRLTDMIDRKMGTRACEYATKKYVALAKCSLVLTVRWFIRNTEVEFPKNMCLSEMSCITDPDFMEDDIVSDMELLSQDMIQFRDCVMEHTSWRCSRYEGISDIVQDLKQDEFEEGSSKEANLEEFMKNMKETIPLLRSDSPYLASLIRDIYDQASYDEGWVDAFEICDNTRIPKFMKRYREHSGDFSEREQGILRQFRDLTDFNINPFYTLCREGMVNGQKGDLLVAGFLSFSYSPSEEVVNEYLMRPEQILKAYLLEELMSAMEKKYPRVFQNEEGGKSPRKGGNVYG